MSSSFNKKRCYDDNRILVNLTTVDSEKDDDIDDHNESSSRNDSHVTVNDDIIVSTKDRFDNTTTGRSNDFNNYKHDKGNNDDDDNDDDDDDNDDNDSVVQEKTIEFDVGGRIYKVRRSLLDLYPSTILSRSAADLWNTSTSDCHRLFSNTFTAAATSNNNVASLPTTASLNDTTAANFWNRQNSNDSTTTTTASNNKKRKKKIIKRKPIYIDRDSHRFSYILDYMRDGGIVELPVTISKESFIKDLLYYGFDSIATETITCAIPTYEAVIQISNLHEHYKNRVKQSDIENDYIHLSYACFCNFVQTRSLHYIVRSNPTNTTTSTATTNNKPSRDYRSGSSPPSLYEYTSSSSKRLSSVSNALTKAIDMNGINPTPSTKDIFNIAKALAKDYQNNMNNNASTATVATTTTTTLTGTTMNLFTPNSKIDLFNKFLHEYGLHCTIAEYDSSLYATTIQMIAYDKEPTL